MKFMLSLLAFGYVALATPAPSLPLHPGGIGGFFKGPNSETIIKGPDGSIITAAAEGGEVINTKLEPIIVAEPEEIIKPIPVAVAPTPVLEAVAVPAPVIEKEQSSDLIGPSGRIATQGSKAIIAGPASTTFAGPAVVAKTVVKGPPIIPSLNVATGPVADAIVPVSVTPSPIIPVSADIAVSPIAVSVQPVAVTASPLPVIPNEPINHGLVATAAPAVAVSVSPKAIATASSLPHISVASATAEPGASAIASAGPNLVSATVQSNGIQTVTATPLPIISSTLRPIPVANGIHRLPASQIPIDGIQELGVNINDRIDLRQLVQDQIAIDNRQLNLNPALIPPANIIPPEIAVTPRVQIGRLRPTSGTLLQTPGLGAVAGSTNIQREEVDAALNVTPNNLQLTPQQVWSLQNQVGINNPVQTGQQVLVDSNIRRTEDIGQAIGPNTLQINSQAELSPQQVQAIQNQQADLNNQLSQVAPQQFSNPDELQNRVLFTPNPNIQTANVQQQRVLDNTQQQSLLANELAKAGVDGSQIQLTNVPLSAVSNIPRERINLANANNLRGEVINDGLGSEAWGRYSREVEEKEKKNTKKAEKKAVRGCGT